MHLPVAQALKCSIHSEAMPYEILFITHTAWYIYPSDTSHNSLH